MSGYSIDRWCYDTQVVSIQTRDSRVIVAMSTLPERNPVAAEEGVAGVITVPVQAIVERRSSTVDPPPRPPNAVPRRI